MGKKERKEKHSVRTNDDDSRRKMEKKKNRQPIWCKNRLFFFLESGHLIGYWIKKLSTWTDISKTDIGFKNEFHRERIPL